MLLTQRPEPDPAPRRGGWKAALPPPISYRGFECATILDELNGELGEHVFQRARDVLLWLGTPPNHREGLFWRSRHEASAAVLSECTKAAAAAFRVLDRVVISPQDVAASRVAKACEAIRQWAEESSFPHTAVWYAELAAGVEPRNPQRAWAVGRALRQNAQYDRARQWLERAVGLARIRGNRFVQGAAFLSLGNLDYHLGRQREARRWWIRAWRVSRKFNLEHAGPARHNLMTLCMLQGRFAEAQDHAAAAFELYDHQAPTFPGFAHDAGQLWSWQGYFTLASMIFEAAIPVLPVKEHLIAYANLARAAAGARDRVKFLAAWEDAERRINPRNEFVAEALASVAEGAQFLGFSARAVDLARRAAVIAGQRQVRDTVELAERIQERVRNSEVPPRPIEPPDAVRALANRIVRALQGAG